MTATTITTLQPKVSSSSSSQSLRSKYLSRIGLHPMPPKAESSTNGLTVSATPPSPSSVVVSSFSTATTTPPSIPPLATMAPTNTRPPVNISTEPLKYDPMADAHYSSKRQRLSPKKRLVFSDKVQVVPIPMRCEYSSRVRSRLWTGAAELYENAARNTVEFAHEGWDWRKVTEDELMHVCVATGELIHPCHYAMLNRNNTDQTSE